MNAHLYKHYRDRLQHYKDVIAEAVLTRRTGKVTEFLGHVLESNGPDVFWGERCEIRSASGESKVMAEVVGMRHNKVLLMPYSQLHGIKLGTDVMATGELSSIPVGDELLGRVIDTFGNPLDDKSPLHHLDKQSIYNAPPKPMTRPVINTILETGIKSVDTLMTIGQGQRIGIFAGSGVGKSTLLGMIARNMNADVNVIAMIGERGREVLDFIRDCLGEDGLKRSVVIVATSDEAALVRSHAALAATTIAEYFREQGKNVVLTMDSLTRFAMAQREIGMAIGEPPTSKGYTPSVFSVLPKLLERAGTSDSGGSITGLYTVLVEGDDVHDPIGDHARAILDGGIYLSRKMANSRHFPAIDVLHSHSRLFSSLVSDIESEEASKLTQDIAIYDQAKDMIEIGAYKTGNNPELDRVIKKWPEINKFLCQKSSEKVRRFDSVAALKKLNTF